MAKRKQSIFSRVKNAVANFGKRVVRKVRGIKGGGG